MSNSQRWFLIASLLALAFGALFFCLEFRVVPEETPEGKFLSARSSAESTPLLIREFEKYFPTPLLSFGKSTPPEDPTLPPWEQPSPTFSGIYARSGLTAPEATIGGILLPGLLLIGAGFLALGRQRQTLRSNRESELPTVGPAGAASQMVKPMARVPFKINFRQFWRGEYALREAVGKYFAMLLILVLAGSVLGALIRFIPWAHTFWLVFWVWGLRIYLLVASIGVWRSASRKPVGHFQTVMPYVSVGASVAKLLIITLWIGTAIWMNEALLSLRF